MGQYEKIDSGPSYEAIFFGDASETSSTDATVAETGILNYRYDPFCSIEKGELMIVDYKQHEEGPLQNYLFHLVNDHPPIKLPSNYPPLTEFQLCDSF